MKLTKIAFAAFAIALVLWFGAKLTAQSNSGVIVLNPVAAPAACAWPTGVTVTNGFALCPTTSGLYWSLNGSPTFSPVASAAVTPAPLKYSDLLNPPTTVACLTYSATSTGGVIASNCTIK